MLDSLLKMVYALAKDPVVLISGQWLIINIHYNLQVFF